MTENQNRETSKQTQSSHANASVQPDVQMQSKQANGTSSTTDNVSEEEKKADEIMGKNTSPQKAGGLHSKEDKKRAGNQNAQQGNQ